jgi:glutathione synthase/RimK-type ligase-like ATP-grasp enzyme
MFRKRLTDWGLAFLKPRFGALGTSVTRVDSTDDLPVFLPGVVPGQEEPAILQRAVSPPLGWAGRSVRVLCQRMPDHSWYQCPAVLRQSRTDPVVNAARGAAVMPAADGLGDETMEQISHACARVCAAIAAADGGLWAVELGVDLVIDSDGIPWVIEVNSRPRGRLEVLAALDGERFADAHLQACARPIRTMAHLLRTEPALDVSGGLKCR